MIILDCNCGYRTINKKEFDKHEKIAHWRRYKEKLRKMRKSNKKKQL